jgi:hypothetical protein
MWRQRAPWQLSPDMCRLSRWAKMTFQGTVFQIGICELGLNDTTGSLCSSRDVVFVAFLSCLVVGQESVSVE